jgi:hypothetical protein
VTRVIERQKLCVAGGRVADALESAAEPPRLVRQARDQRLRPALVILTPCMSRDEDLPVPGVPLAVIGFTHVV